MNAKMLKSILTLGLVLTFVNVAQAQSSPEVASTVAFAGRTYTVLSNAYPLECDRAPDRRDCAPRAELAEEACESLGLEVPTVYDFADLLRAIDRLAPNSIIERPFFGGANLPRLTDSGVTEFLRLFEFEDGDTAFWTSTRKPSMPDEVPNTSAWQFTIGSMQTKRYSEYTSGRVFYAKRVICVSR